MIPFREYRPFEFLVFTGISDDNNPDAISNWNDSSSSEYCYAGDWVITGGFPPALSVGHSRAVARPSDPNFASLEGLSNPIDYWIELEITPRVATEIPTTAILTSGIQRGPASPAAWNSDLATGKYYDGSTPWAAFPPSYFIDGNAAFSVSTFANGSTPGIIYGCSYQGGTNPIVHTYRADLFRNGFCFYVTNYWHATKTWPADFSAGASGVIDFNILSVKIRFFNPVVNSLSRTAALPAGGQSLILNGLGFVNDDTEITNATNNPNSSTPVGGWHDGVTEIIFTGINGEGTYTLTSIAGDFTNDSNTQITIPALPSMAAGTYNIKLRKTGMNALLGDIPYAYAGDFRTDSEGRVKSGGRFYLTVSTSGGDTGGKTGGNIVLTKWKFRKKDGTYIFRYYAPIDTVTTAAFFDGRILSLSSLNRSVSDRTGLYSASDMNITLANHDKEFSKLLAEYFLKNQAVSLYMAPNTGAFNPQPAAGFIVDDYDIKGPAFSATLKDISTKYFRGKVPRFRCTEDIYPNILKEHIGRPMPEILGLASYTAPDNGGAVEAVYIDKTLYKYLAARGSLHAILRVYADGALKSASDYTVSYADGGRTYITFNSDQGEAKITFDAEGYMFTAWNSAAGYVQNPGYIMLFYLCFLLEIPPEDIDFDSFITIAASFTAAGYGTSGFLIIQNEEDPAVIQGELNFTYGAMTCFDINNRFKAVILDYSSLAGAYFIFAQIDTTDFPLNKYNLGTAVNKIRAAWDYSPAAEVFAGGKTIKRDSSIKDLEAELESDSGFEFKWTNSESLVDKRTTEELLRRGYGSADITFSLPSEFGGTVDLLDIFRLQNPFGVNASGSGDVGRYCLITEIGTDPGTGRLDIKAIDLGWLLRQYFIFGSEAELAATWAAASDEARIYGYLCSEASGYFSDGEPGKILISEN